MDGDQNSEIPQKWFADNPTLEYYYKIDLKDAAILSFDIWFEGRVPAPLLFRFPEIPLPTSATIFDDKRAVFHMATVDPLWKKWKNSVYWLRYLVRVEEENGPIASINRCERKMWQWLFAALGPRDEWVDLGPDWPAPT